MNTLGGQTVTQGTRWTRKLLPILVVFGLHVVKAQSFSVSDITGLNFYTYFWTPLTVAGGGGAYLADPTADQQTGQYQDDLLGSATTPGFFMKYGQINGVDSVAFRMVENKVYTDNKGNPTFGGQASIGMDSDGDGAIDIVFTVIGKNQSNGINYQAPGTGANVSPNTTTLGGPVLISAFNATNFDYRIADASIYPGWTQITGDPDAVLTFAISFASLNAALNAVGKASITPSTLVRFIAFTSTQTNAINQDVYGSTGISSAVRFDAPGGGFTEWTDSTGRPVPEPPTIFAVGALLSVGCILHYRRKKTARTAAAALGAAGRA